MKKIHVIKNMLLTLGCIILASCVDDSIDQNYTMLNELTLKMDPQKALQAPENANDSILVKIAPEIILPGGRSQNDLSFEWRIQTERNYATVWDVYSTSDTLTFYVKSDTKNTFFRLGVTDNELGITTYQEFTIIILKPFENNWFVLQNIGGQSVLGSIEVPGETPLITPDIFQAKYGQPISLTGSPKALNYCFLRTSASSEPSEWRLQVLTNSDGAIYDSKSLKEKIYEYSTSLYPVPTNDDIKSSHTFQQGQIITNNGELYFSTEDGSYMYFKGKFAEDIKKTNIINAVAFNTRNVDGPHLLAFDEQNKCFLYCKPYVYPGAGNLFRKAPNMGEIIYNNYTNILVQKVPNYANEGKPNKFSPQLDENHHLLFMDNWYDGNVVAFTHNKKDGKVHVFDFSSSSAAKKDTCFCLAEKTCELNGNVEDAHIAVSNFFKKIFFYASGNKVYRVDLNRSTPTTILIYEHPDASARIHVMKFRHSNFSSMVDADGDDEAETSLKQTTTLGLAVEKADKWSVTEIHLAASGDIEKDDKKNPKVYEYDGFGEIIDIAYTFACKWW